MPADAPMVVTMFEQMDSIHNPNISQYVFLKNSSTSRIIFYLLIYTCIIVGG